MSEGTHQAYIDKMDAQLREWNAKIEVAKAKMAQETADVRLAFHREIESWPAKEQLLKEKLQELRSAGEDGLDAIKSGIKNVWNEMTNSVESLEVKSNVDSKQV